MRTDGQTDMTELTVVSSNFTKAAKKWIKISKHNRYVHDFPLLSTHTGDTDGYFCNLNYQAKVPQVLPGSSTYVPWITVSWQNIQLCHQLFSCLIFFYKFLNKIVTLNSVVVLSSCLISCPLKVVQFSDDSRQLYLYRCPITSAVQILD